MKRDNIESVDDAVREANEISNGTTSNQENGHRNDVNGINGQNHSAAETNGTIQSVVSSPNDEKQSSSMFRIYYLFNL